MFKHTGKWIIDIDEESNVKKLTKSPNFRALRSSTFYDDDDIEDMLIIIVKSMDEETLVKINTIFKNELKDCMKLEEYENKDGNDDIIPEVVPEIIPELVEQKKGYLTIKLPMDIIGPNREDDLAFCYKLKDAHQPSI